MSEVYTDDVYHFIREIRRHMDLMNAYHTNPPVAHYHYCTAQRAVDALSSLYSA